MASPQANGYYPRLNAAMVSSGKFNGNIVSLMGRFVSGATDGQHVSFQCSDGGTLSLSVEHADFPNMDVMDGPVVEVVGQVMKENEVAVRLEHNCIVCIMNEIQLPHVRLLILRFVFLLPSRLHFYSSLSRENFPRTRTFKSTTR
jgi:uncharacterized protein YdeI (BOF family)